MGRPTFSVFPWVLEILILVLVLVYQVTSGSPLGPSFSFSSKFLEGMV